jgi:hypothetical protein
MYRPHVEKVLAAAGIMPVQVMLEVMRRHYRARRFDNAARVASLAAPYVSPRLAATAITVKPSLNELIFQATDEELAELAEAADAAADFAEAGLAERSSE